MYGSLIPRSHDEWLWAIARDPVGLSQNERLNFERPLHAPSFGGRMNTDGETAGGFCNHGYACYACRYAGGRSRLGICQRWRVLLGRPVQLLHRVFYRAWNRAALRGLPTDCAIGGGTKGQGSGDEQLGARRPLGSAPRIEVRA